MSHGSGKYDGECTQVREVTSAHSVLFTDRALMVRFPALLQNIADQIERDVKGMQQ